MMCDADFSRSERVLLQMLYLLRLLEQRPATIHFLAEKLKLSDRQVHRYITTLTEVGIPLVYNNISQEWSIVPERTFFPIDLSLLEILAILVLFEEYGNDLDEPLFSSIRTVAIKASLLISPHFVDRLVKIREKIHLKSISWNNLNDLSCSSVFDIVYNAMNNGKTLHIHYQTPLNPVPIDTLLKPYAFLFVRAWYVIGYAGLYRQIRTFKINRILDLEVTEDVFTRPAIFSLKEYLGNAWCMIPGEEPDYQVVVHFSKKVAQNVAEIKWHQTQKVYWRSDGTVELHFQVSGLNEIIWWILSYGSEAEVLEPIELRKMIYQHLIRLRNQYTKEGPVY